MEDKTPYDSSMIRINGVTLADAFRSGKRVGKLEGRREVVEWIEKNGQYAETSHDSTMSAGEEVFGADPSEWQNKLKEWMLDNG